MKHRIRWYVYAGRERIPRTATMRGAWGCDAVCSCGWQTNTGGGTRRSVESEVWAHKWDVAHGFAEGAA
jgi:hypothetical protein